MKSAEVFLKHMLEEIDFLTRATKERKLEDFMKDETMKRACSRSLEVIGEAVKNIPPDFKKKHPEVEWKKLAGLRDKLIHHYFGVNWDVLWDVISQKLPELKRRIEKILRMNHEAI